MQHLTQDTWNVPLLDAGPGTPLLLSLHSGCSCPSSAQGGCAGDKSSPDPLAPLPRSDSSWEPGYLLLSLPLLRWGRTALSDLCYFARSTGGSHLPQQVPPGSPERRPSPPRALGTGRERSTSLAGGFWQGEGGWRPGASAEAGGRGRGAHVAAAPAPRVAGVGGGCRRAQPALASPRVRRRGQRTLRPARGSANPLPSLLRGKEETLSNSAGKGAPGADSGLQLAPRSGPLPLPRVPGVRLGPGALLPKAVCAWPPPLPPAAWTRRAHWARGAMKSREEG